jgi:hypothetical protein
LLGDDRNYFDTRSQLDHNLGVDCSGRNRFDGCL